MGKHLESAKKYRDAGFSPIPISEPKNGTLLKTPYASVLPLVDGKPSWSPFQDRKATDEEMERMWSNGAIVAVTCGKASGNLEVIDFDEPGYFDAWKALVDDDLLGLLTVMQTPSGGFHVWYRTEDVPEGNQILARTRDGKTAIETRGHGGYVLCAPSPGYKIEQGSPKKTPSIDDEQREDLINAARMLNQKPAEPRDYSKTSSPTVTRPGDRYARENSWMSIMAALGFTESHSKGQNTYWTRPGKKRGISASTNGEDGYLYVFTSNAPPLQPSQCYTKFGVYAEVHFGGDFYAAAQYLSKDNPQAKQERKEQAKAIQEKEDRTWTTLASIEPKKVEWLWEPYIPKGMVTLVYGDGGIGKSTAMLAVIAGLSLGVALPGQDALEQGNAIILSAEDPPDTVLVPRLRSLEANLNKIIAPLEFDEEGRANPMVLDECGIETLYQRAVKYEAKIVVIDPALAYFEATKDTNSGTDVRAFMRALAKLAHDADCAVVLIHHTNKSSASAAQYRVAGSNQFINACRSALYVVADPEDANNCAMIHQKHNLSPAGPTLGYTWKDGVFGWTGQSDLTAADAAAVPQSTKVKKGAVDDAKAWILDTLGREGEVKAIDIYAGAKLDGIQPAAIKRAKADLKDQVRSNKQTDGSWTWSLRATATNYYWEDKNDPYYEP